MSSITGIPGFRQKHEFAESVIQIMEFEVYDYAPISTGIKYNEKLIELVARYPFGNGCMDLPLNIEEPSKRQEFACGLQWMLRPKQNGMTWNWKTVFIGHKSSDVDPFEGPVPLKHDAAKTADVNLVFPFRHWTDDDIWNYIEKNHVPYDKRRYAGRMETPNKWLNPDYLHACTACVDPRNQKEVHCPKLNRMVANVSDGVPRFGELPDYVRSRKKNMPNYGQPITPIFGGGLAGYEPAYAEAALKYGIDPNLLMSISMFETGQRNFDTCWKTKNNVGGLADPKGGYRSFDSIPESIDFMAKNLKNNYIDKGLTTIPQDRGEICSCRGIE